MLVSWIQTPLVLEAALLALAFAAGGFGALLGLGGGVLIVPGMTLLFGIPIRYAIGASIVSVIATSSGAAAAYVRDRLTNIRVAILLEVATTTGALSGAYLSSSISSRLLYLLFAGVLLLSAGMMLRKRSSHAPLAAPGGPLARWLKLSSSYPDAHLRKEVEYHVTGVPLAFSLMVAAGLLSGLLGIGSGALKVPAMDTAMRLPIKVSSATSNFMIGVTAAASAGPYMLRGDILPVLAAPIALGILAGSWCGAKLMNRVHASHLRKLFIATLLVIASQMLLKYFGWNFR